MMNNELDGIFEGFFGTITFFRIIRTALGFWGFCAKRIGFLALILILHKMEGEN